MNQIKTTPEHEAVRARRRIVPGCLCAAVLLLGVQVVSAAAPMDQSDAPPTKPEQTENHGEKPKLTKAQAALERCIKAMGEPEAWKSVESLSFRLRIKVDTIEFENEVHVRPNGDFAMRQIGERARKIAMGQREAVSWFAVGGLPAREVPEAHIAIPRAMAQSPLLPQIWKLTKQPMHVVGEVEFDEQPCLRVRLAERTKTTPTGAEGKASKKADQDRYALFSVETGLLVALDVPHTQKKDTRAFVRFFDMKPCGDLLLPTRVESDQTGVKQTRRMSDIQFNIAKAQVFETPTDLIRNPSPNG